MPATSDLSSRPVLGIETSCDETACAVYDGERGLLAHALYSQVRLHAEYGGVVPELASRDHVARIHGLVRGVLDEAGIVPRSEEHTSELQSLMRNSYAVFCLKKKKKTHFTIRT